MLVCLAGEVVERPLVRLANGPILQIKTPAIKIERDGRIEIVIFLRLVLDDAVVPFCNPVVEPAKCFDRLANRHVLDAEMAQPRKAGRDVQRDVVVAAAARHPRPAAVGVLRAGKLLKQPLGLGVEPVFVEQNTDVAAGLAFGFGLAHPRRLEQQQAFEFLVFLERTVERVGAFPQVEHAADARIGLGDVTGKRVGVKPVERLLGAVVRVLHQVGQGEHGVPSGIGRHLHGERLVLQRVRLAGLDQFFEAEFLRALASNRQRQRLGDEDAPRQHRQIILLAVPLVAGRGGHLIHERRRAVRHGEPPRETARLASGNGELLFGRRVAKQRVGGRLGLGVLQVELHAADALGFAGVDDARGELQRIALAQESRRVRPHHQVERRHRRAVEIAGARLGVVRESHQPPLGQRLRHGETQLHFAGFVRDDVREKERRLVEVFADGNRGGLGLRRRLAEPVLLILTGEKTRFRIGHGNHAHAVSCHSGLKPKHLRVSDHCAAPSHHGFAPHAVAGVPLRDLVGECPVAVRWNRNRVAIPTAEQVVEALAVVGETEMRARVVITINAELPLPMVRRERVERGVVQRGHHFGDRLLGAGSGDRRRPRFLLPRAQLRDEPLPLHVEFHVRPRHVHVMRALQHPVLANLRHVNGEPAAHLLSDRNLEQPLRASGRGPKTLRDFVPMLDFDKCAAHVVASTPKQPERLARLEAVFLGGHQLRQANGQALGRRVDHLQRVDRLDRFAEPIRGLEHRAVHADRQLGLDLGQALGVGLDLVRGHRLAKRPRLRVGAIDLRLGCPWPSGAADQPRPLDCRRLLDRVNCQCALG